MECGEPPWPHGRKGAKVRCVRTGAGPTAAQRYHAADLGVQFGLPAIEEAQDEQHRIVILYARVSSTKQLRYIQDDRVRADTEHNNFECTCVEEHGAVDWEASMAR